MTLSIEFEFDLGDLRPTWGYASARVSENSSDGLRVEITHAEIPLLGLRECKGMLSRVAILDLEARFVELYNRVIEHKETHPDDYERGA